MENISLLESPEEFFNGELDTAFQDRKLLKSPEAVNYLSRLLSHYIFTGNLFEFNKETQKHQSKTLAEQFLVATSSPAPQKRILLKKLADSTLYICGFFGDSLNRKIVDIDYYAEIGGSAYGALSAEVNDQNVSELYADFSGRFLEFVDVLTLVSQKAMVQSNKDILRLFDRYLATGSELAKDQLAENGIVADVVLKKTSQ